MRASALHTSASDVGTHHNRAMDERPDGPTEPGGPVQGGACGIPELNLIRAGTLSRARGEANWEAYEMNGIVMTHHAMRRANQRGVTSDLLLDLLKHADREVHVGQGCTCVFCSHQALRKADLPASVIERLKGLRAILSDGAGELVTVFRDHGKGTGRRYRRQWA